jgi:DNA modification methylase
LITLFSAERHCERIITQRSKPIRLMSYLITTGSRPGDIVLDFFSGTGTISIVEIAMGRNVEMD